MSQKVQQDNLFQLLNSVNSDLQELKRNATVLAWQPDGTTIVVDEENGNIVGIPIGGITAEYINSVNAQAIIGEILAGQIGTINADQISGSINAGQISSVNASVITGSILAEQIASVNASSITGSINATQISSVSASTITGLINSGQISSINANQISGGITAGQILSVNATQITGALTAAQIISVNADQITGTLTATQINSVFADTITGTITSDQIDTILAGQIDGLISSSQIQNIAAGQITGQVTAGQIAASAIDGFTITGAIIRSSAPGSGVPRWQGDTTGIRGYNVAGEVTFAFDNTTGKITTLAGIGGGNKLVDSSFDIVNLPNWVTYVPNYGGGTIIDATTSITSTTEFTTSSTSGTGILERRTDAARSGGYGCRATLLTGTTHIGIAQPLDLSKYARVDVPYTLSVYFRATAGAEISLVIDEYGGASGYLATQQNFLATGLWQRVSVTRPFFMADSTAGNVYVWRNNATAGQYIEADDFQFEEGNLITAYAPKTDEVLPGTLTTIHLNENAGIVAGQIASVNASTITGTIVATQIDSVNATDIVGNIVATQISSIYAGNITVGGGANGGYLNGAFVAAGTIDAGKLTADAIDGKIITGATIRTAISGARIELSPVGFKQYALDGITELVSFPSDGSPSSFAGEVTASRGINLKTSTLTIDNDNWNEIGWYDDPSDISPRLSIIGYAPPTWLTNGEEVRGLGISASSGSGVGAIRIAVGDDGSFNFSFEYNDSADFSRNYGGDIFRLLPGDSDPYSDFVRKVDTANPQSLPLWANWESFHLQDNTQTPASYLKDGSGTVHLQGLVKRINIAFSFPIAVFTLPELFRPAKQKIFIVRTYDSNNALGIATLVINSGGTATLYEQIVGNNNGGVGEYICLDGISFTTLFA
jgi:hypothetical protein